MGNFNHLKEHIEYMRHKQARRGHSTFIADASSFEKIMICVESHLVVNTPPDSWGCYDKSLHTGNVLFSQRDQRT